MTAERMDNVTDESLWLEPERGHVLAMQSSHQLAELTCDAEIPPTEDKERLDLISIIDEIAKDDAREDSASSGYTPLSLDQEAMQLCNDRHSSNANMQGGAVNDALDSATQLCSERHSMNTNMQSSFVNNALDSTNAVSSYGNSFASRGSRLLDNSFDDNENNSFHQPFHSRAATSLDNDIDSTSSTTRDNQRNYEHAETVPNNLFYAAHNSFAHKDHATSVQNTMQCRTHNNLDFAEPGGSLDHRRLTFDMTSLPSASSGSSSSGSSIFAQLNPHQQYPPTWTPTQPPSMTYQPTIMENEPWEATHQYNDQDNNNNMMSFGWQPDLQQPANGDFVFQPDYHRSPQESSLEPMEAYRERQTNAWQPANDSTPADDDDNSDPSDPCYAQLLYRCLKEAPNHTLTLKELYEWVSQHSQKAKDPSNRGWQNSVRHNLSMNAAFKRVTQTESTSGKKGSLWRLTDEALTLGGVISTTRYRKDPKRKPERKSAAPALKRQISGARGGAATRAATRRNQRLESQQQQQQGLTSYPRGGGGGGSAVRERERARRVHQMQQQGQQHYVGHQQQQQQQQQQTSAFNGPPSSRWETPGMPTPMSAGSSLHGSPHLSHGLPLQHQQRFPVPPPPPGTIDSPYFLNLHSGSGSNTNSLSPQPTQQQQQPFPQHRPHFALAQQQFQHQQQQQHQHGEAKFDHSFELGPIDYTDGRLFGDQDSLQPETPSSFMTEESGLGGFFAPQRGTREMSSS